MLARKEVEKQKALLETIFEAAPIGLAFFDTDMRVVSMNAAFAAMGHFDQDTVQGKSFYDLMPAARHGQEGYIRVLQGESHTAYDVPFPDPVDKRVRYYDVYDRPVQDAEGHVIGLMSVVLDVTERRESERKKDEFLSLTSHELKTPLTAIKGYTQIAIKAAEHLSTPDHTLTRALKTADTKINTMIDLIEVLLDVTSIERGELPIDSEPVDLCSSGGGHREDYESGGSRF